jgi:SAM-dependent methyltransferase
MSSQLSGLARLREHFEGQDPSIHGSKWNELWSQGFSPWDRGSPSPALVDLLAERKDLLPPNKNSGKKKALVPGCGNGYDVLLLSSWGYDAYGLDISEKALENARKTEKENAGQGVYEGKGEKGSVTWVSGDFFKDDFLQKVGGNRKFDFIYDYTVSCIPSKRVI